MFPKYLKSDCLIIKEPESVGKITEFLDNGEADEVPEPKFNKTVQEKNDFFNRINKTE